jgi:8-oxo-dGTP pyrophosphatase MutT (NUDIX family)
VSHTPSHQPKHDAVEPAADDAFVPDLDGLPEWLLPLAKAVADIETADQAVGGRGVERRSPDAAGQARRSAVLILFGEAAAEGPDLLFVERAKTLRSHPGQPAFPGGKIDPGESPVETALREAEEETALEPAGVQVFGTLPELYLTPSDFLVTPVLGWWRSPSEVRVRDLREVASVRRIPVSELADPANRVTVVHPSGFVGPAFLAGSLLIWGFTAGLLDGVLRFGGWEREWDRSRTHPLPEEVVALARRSRLAAAGPEAAGIPAAASRSGLDALGPLDGSAAGENA